MSRKPLSAVFRRIVSASLPAALLVSCGGGAPDNCNPASMPIPANLRLPDGGVDETALCALCHAPYDSCVVDTGSGTYVCGYYACSGRRPEGLAALPAGCGPALGPYFARMAWLEAGSVHAFRRLARELRHHRAPRALVRAAERAARDEIRHARVTGGLARRHGARTSTPPAMRFVPRDLEALALENATEGCAREALGALVATWQGATARDPVIRSAMARIAADETRHAELAFGVFSWAKPRLSRAARKRVDTARRETLESLAAAAQADPPTSLREPLGLPSAVEWQQLATALAQLAA